ncbi:hypothetical protein Droror1_Dr00008248 [Drosera rotundifolia]
MEMLKESHTQNPTMHRLAALSTPPTRPLRTPTRTHHHRFIPFTSPLRPLKPVRLHRLIVYSTNSGADAIPKQTNTKNKDQKGVVSDDDDGDGGGDGPKLNLDWARLLLDPDPDNILAVGLTGLLAWASVQVLWQLLVVSVAIVVAALKYSFVAGLLLFILITLL